MERKLIIGSQFTNYSKTITHQAEIFQGKLSTIVMFIPCKLCVNLNILVFGLTNVAQGVYPFASVDVYTRQTLPDRLTVDVS